MIDEPKGLSYSQLTTYAECGEKWRLEKGYKLNNRTWFASVAGSAIHNITELRDLVRLGKYDGEIPTFEEEFDRLLAEEDEKGVQVVASGRVLKAIGTTGGPNKKDREWWLQYGPEYLDNWEKWIEESDWTLAVMPDGRPGIEIGIDVQVGSEPLRGYIDRVMIDKRGRVAVVDLKSGAVPKSKLQLGTYKVGLEREYGIEADFGAYWIASTGDLTPLVDLSQFSSTFIDSLYEQAWRGIRAGVFLPNVTSMCNGCGVKDYCRAFGGELAITIPNRETVKLRTPALDLTPSV